ncbi:type II secretion system F family protein [Caulobacter sp. NIBR1757]|uniref:type II secretion system F family protein n=1 Tax=Caulobacter sp. NIBR1757 TaxID=3016000 RepID=UPI0022F08E9D|nr:type II secretion system F family protein [Caulobacter sp. NIBR1757]
MAQQYDYTAANPAGARISGSLTASDERAAFEALRQQGLRPIRLTPVRVATAAGQVRLSPRAVSELTADLAALLQAGASLKSALSVIMDAGASTSAGAAARALSDEIAKGVSLDKAFGGVLGARYPFLPALVAAGEASGALPDALQTVSTTIERDLEIAEQVGGALSYPGFVLLMTLASVLMIILFVVPALAPIIEESGGETSLVLGGLIAVSQLLTEHPLAWSVALLALALGLAGAWRMGLLEVWFQRFLLDGPLRGVVRGLVFGGFSKALGHLLAARAPAPEAIRLAIGSVRLKVAAERLDGLATAVRGGASLSQALAEVPSAPRSLAQMARIGEETGTLGAMLERAGVLEQARALRAIKSQTKWLGPALIIVLGVMIGILMSGLLSGVSALGGAGIS